MVQKRIEHTELFRLYLSSSLFLYNVKHYIFILVETKIDPNFLNLNKTERIHPSIV